MCLNNVCFIKHCVKRGEISAEGIHGRAIILIARSGSEVDVRCNEGLKGHDRLICGGDGKAGVCSIGHKQSRSRRRLAAWQTFGTSRRESGQRKGVAWHRTNYSYTVYKCLITEI